MHEFDNLNNAKMLSERFRFTDQLALADRLWATHAAFEQQPQDPDLEAEVKMQSFLLRQVILEAEREGAARK